MWIQLQLRLYPDSIILYPHKTLERLQGWNCLNHRVIFMIQSFSCWDSSSLLTRVRRYWSPEHPNWWAYLIERVVTFTNNCFAVTFVVFITHWWSQISLYSGIDRFQQPLLTHFNCILVDCSTTIIEKARMSIQYPANTYSNNNGLCGARCSPYARFLYWQLPAVAIYWKPLIPWQWNNCDHARKFSAVQACNEDILPWSHLFFCCLFWERIRHSPWINSPIIFLGGISSKLSFMGCGRNSSVPACTVVWDWYHGRRYPSKAIAGIAATLMRGRNLPLRISPAE